MIATLSGEVSEKLGELVVLDVQGLGYGIYVTSEDFGRLNIGEPNKLYIHEHIRENAHDLFGFANKHTKALFELLLGVNGVGPKMALNVLSIGNIDDVRAAIASGDTKFIQAAQGVGKRVAERIIVDLKDKVGMPGIDFNGIGLLQTDGVLRQDEAVEALVALGYSPHDAAKALHGVDNKLAIEERIKHALKGAHK